MLTSNIKSLFFAIVFLVLSCSVSRAEIGIAQVDSEFQDDDLERLTYYIKGFLNLDRFTEAYGEKEVTKVRLTFSTSADGFGSTTPNRQWMKKIATCDINLAHDHGANYFNNIFNLYVWKKSHNQKITINLESIEVFFNQDNSTYDVTNEQKLYIIKNINKQNLFFNKR